MYENKKEAVISPKAFVNRLNRHLYLSALTIFISLIIGILGYHYIAEIEWLDAVHNASMILGGMGPVVTVNNVAGKIFSSFYALFSGIIFISNIGIILAPFIHRILHKLNVE